jgi:hypothetical protein
VLARALEEIRAPLHPRTCSRVPLAPRVEGRHLLRFAFLGEATGAEPGRALDKEIRRVLWLTPDEIRALVPHHRSPLVMTCVDDALAGRRYPLDLLRHLA